jgi:N6-adenosine-specific RNA methylase IME4
MSLSEMKALPVAEWAEPNAHLYLWTTNAFFSEAHELAETWGFEPKTVLTWGKVKPDGSPSMKMGHYYRGATEHAIFCVRGRLKLIGEATRPTLYLSPRLGHSVKPDWFYQLVEEKSPGPRLEMFARRSRVGWDAWGNEAPSSQSQTEVPHG